MTKFYRAAYIILAGFFRFLYRVKVSGLENMPEDGKILVCANHTSAADAIVICAAMKRQVCFMAKTELFKIPVLSWFLRALGTYPIDRSGGDVGAVKHTVVLLKEGKAVGMFPQGTRHPGVDPRTTKVKNGVALIITHAESDVLPIYIDRKNNTCKIFRKTHLIVGKPIKYEELGFSRGEQGEYQRISNVIFDEICRLGEEYRNEQ